MIRTKVAGVALAVAALAAGPLAAPAQAQADLPCETLFPGPPYDYPCVTAESAANFAINEAGEAIQFVFQLRDEAGEVVFRAYCIAFPNQPECQ